jgi:hypothetical protein
MAGVWTFPNGVASFVGPQCAMSIDPREPLAGLQGITAFGESRPDDVLAAVESFAAFDEAYIRQGDLVVIGSRRESYPFRVQTYYRAGWVDELSKEGVTGLDVQISVQTDLLDANPRMRVFHRLPIQGQPLAGNAEGFKKISADGLDGTREFPPEEGSCLLLRLPGETISAVVLAHPADLIAVRLTQGDRDGVAVLSIQQDLFPLALEKGVLLRARLRVAYVAREDDEQRARSVYEQLLASPLPLTT